MEALVQPRRSLCASELELDALITDSILNNLRPFEIEDESEDEAGAEGGGKKGREGRRRAFGYDIGASMPGQASTRGASQAHCAQHHENCLRGHRRVAGCQGWEDKISQKNRQAACDRHRKP